MAEIFPPRQTSDVLHDVDITGYLMPWANDQIIYIKMTGAGDTLYLPLFADEKELRNFMDEMQLPCQEIKQVLHGRDFLSSIPPEIIVIYNLHKTERNTIKFRQLLRYSS